MYLSPILPKNINGVLNDELTQLSEDVCIKSASLLSGYPPQIIASIKELLRITNSYYSNRIEAQSTHPIEIEKAMRKEFSSDTKEELLQRLSVAHIDTQIFIESNSLDSEDIINKEYIKKIHKLFYSSEGMEKLLNIKTDALEIQMSAGEFRVSSVAVGKHVAPDADKINSMFNYFEKEYKTVYKNNTKAVKLLAALSAHHRLVYIHPFLDGNGRVSRLFLDAMLFSMELSGYGLWNISRGLAKDIQAYQKNLSLADMIKQGATDGRGDLSLRGLEYYLKYMLEVAKDQIEFMDESLKLTTLDARINNFVEISQKGMFNTEPLPKYSELLFSRLLIRGELPRGEVERVINKSKKTAFTLVKKLLEMNYLESDSPRGTIRLKFNTFFASKLIPDLIPEG